MELEYLQSGFEYVATTGFKIGVEQQVAIRNSLTILKNENKFQHIFFWGRILGLASDYFIADGYAEDALESRKAFYSKDCVEWGLLPVIPPEKQSLSLQCRTRFMGDPSFEYACEEIVTIGEGERSFKEEKTIILKEEDRLASLVSEISTDAAVVPRGAYYKLPNETIVQNQAFHGLSLSECSKLSSYFHLKPPTKKFSQHQQSRSDADVALDCLDTIDGDIPRGCWCLQTEHGGRMVILRNLFWPGLTFYHIPNTPEHGYVYTGIGQKNMDLPFML